MTLRSIGGLSLVALIVLAACGKGADGDPCTVAGDCESGVCSLSGKCGTGDCACTGFDCGKIRSTCDEGFVCWRSSKPLEADYPVCRRACSAEQRCPADQHCEVGLCVAGAPPFGLTWTSLPRATRCAPQRACEYKVRVDGDVAVATFAWRIGAATFETKAPEYTHTYPKGGMVDVSVEARATDGRTARTSTKEAVCLPTGEPCDPNATPPCCSEACDPQGKCR